MVGESSQNVFLIQIDASNFEISEFEISRVDCTTVLKILEKNKKGPLNTQTVN